MYIYFCIYAYIYTCAVPHAAAVWQTYADACQSAYVSRRQHTSANLFEQIFPFFLWTSRSSSSVDITADIC